MNLRPVLPAILLLLAGCASTAPAWSTSPRPDVESFRMRTEFYVPDLPISQAPFHEVHASWKQRLEQPYVFMEHSGSYTETGALIPTLHRELLAQGLEPSGPPFALFYDDPASTPIGELRSRACVPILAPRSPVTPLRYDVLPSTTVAYAFAAGPYPEAPRVYPGVFAFMEKMNWALAGPIREVYLTPPSADTPAAELICEVQVPSAPR